MSDIDSMDSDDLPGTPDTNDLKFSDDDLSNSVRLIIKYIVFSYGIHLIL